MCDYDARTIGLSKEIKIGFDSRLNRSQCHGTILHGIQMVKFIGGDSPDNSRFQARLHQISQSMMALQPCRLREMLIRRDRKLSASVEHAEEHAVEIRCVAPFEYRIRAKRVSSCSKINRSSVWVRPTPTHVNATLITDQLNDIHIVNLSLENCIN